MFIESHCIFQHKNSKKMIESARMFDDLYNFNRCLFSNNKVTQDLSSISISFLLKNKSMPSWDILVVPISHIYFQIY